jgi:reactive chlorine resistance protein C
LDKAVTRLSETIPVMTSDQTRPRTDSNAMNSAIAVAAGVLARYGLALVIGWIGALKFTSYEAQGNW